jgi:hypothetical protein
MISQDEEARLAFDLWKALDQFQDLLWSRYEEEFLNLTEADHTEGLEENTEVAF